MSKKLILLPLGVFLVLAVALVASGERSAIDIPKPVGPLQFSPEKAACTMTKTSGTVTGYYPAWVQGERVVTYYDPANFCAAPLYPLELTTFYFVLYDDGAGVQWPVVMDIVVYEADLSDPTCPVPGTELCRFSHSCTQADFDQVIGSVSFPTPCCITGPVFVGVEYADPGNGPFPSLLFDDNAAPASCDNYDYYNSQWYEWYSVWNPVVGYPLFWVDGETNSSVCGACTWAPGDDHKMHFPQLPNETGWDVMATFPQTLAEDWQCSETGWVKDIHFWGSWKDDLIDNILFFQIAIYSDIPADPPQVPYSHPDQILWEAQIGDYEAVPIDPGTMEGWYDPATEEVLWNNHQSYFQYNICLPEQQWFWQEAGTIYWLEITAVLPDGSAALWGWKSTNDHFNDDAVWTDATGIPWQEVWEPAEPLVNDFHITMDPNGFFVGGGGTGAYGNGWYYYELDEWWNIWYYDHPLDPERRKIGFIEFDIYPLDPGLPQSFEIAVNWSTDQWANPNDPPLPGDDGFVGRQSLLIFNGQIEPGHYRLPYEIPDYNPEWVSVDVRGYNFEIPLGIIQHECQGSMDLSFVITGGPDETGACCFDDGSCLTTTATDCANQGGTFQGVGTVCLGDGNGNFIDDACEGVVQSGACCYQDGTCVTTTSAACAASGGSYQGGGTYCLGDTSPANGIDDACETGPFGACCFADGSCNVLSALDCGNQGGTYMGDGTLCLGDNDGNNIDDACEMGACCYNNGTCAMLTANDCANSGGVFAGNGSVCLGDGNGNLIDDACEGAYPVGACCMTDGSCVSTTAIICAMNNGTYKGDGTSCLGDNNSNGIDDICEYPQELKWIQQPDLSPTGIDVNATAPLILADDFLCTQAGPVFEIHVWGSWLNDFVPEDPANVAFTLSIHSDIPADPPNQPFSMPGPMIWMRTFAPGEFLVAPYAVELEESWYDPAQAFYLPFGDTQCWHYIFHLDPGEFIQEGNAANPIVYWLDVQAMPQAGGAQFGWKTSLEHWNDDATWGMGEEPYPGPWNELRYPDGHPLHPESIDLSFAIYGEVEQPCDCEPGKVDGDDKIDLLDILYLIDYKFKHGPAPIPYDTCSGDVNCDCVVNLLDILYMIEYKFKHGPAPCDCTTWVTNCDWPLRKD